MAAIVSKEFRLNATKKFINDIKNNFPEFPTQPDTADYNANSYYVFIGRSEPWADDQLPPSPYDNYYSSYYDAWQHMTALKKIGPNDISFATVRRQWIAGTTYSQYDDRSTTMYTSSANPYYVISDNNNVYICLKSGPGASTSNPDNVGVQVSGVIDFSNEDGYIWKYLYTLTTQDALNFLTSAFIPVRYIEEDPGVSADAALRNQWAVQGAAVDGAVYNIVVTNPGSGYTGVPTVTVTGDGQNLAATAIVTAGQVTGVTIDNPGTGYTSVAIRFDGGGATVAEAEGYAVLGPPGGFGADPRNDLRSHYCVLNARLVYDDGGGDFITGNDFRQIGIIRNPLNFGTSTIATDTTLSATKSLAIQSGGTWPVDSTIESSGGARAIIDHYDNTTHILRYHQTPETGFADFAAGEEVYIADTIGALEYAILTSAQTDDGNPGVYDPEVQPFSGEIIFLENRTPINRNSDQIETIKLVLEF